MYTLKLLFATLVLGFASAQPMTSFLHEHDHEDEMSTFFSDFGSWSCPSPDDFIASNPEYTSNCVESSIPPYPLCLFHDVEYFVNSAIASASRCCGNMNDADYEQCKCPLKSQLWWQEKIIGWCEDILECPDSNMQTALRDGGAQLETEVWASFLHK
jgi:hypothetical protein